MAKKPTLYLESSVVSYLTNRLSRDLIVAGHQQITQEWWETSRQGFDIYVSEAVLREIQRGDSDAAARRASAVQGFPVLAATEESEDLARTYQEKLGLPPDAELDAIHLAFSVAYQMGYLLTWNCAHLANGVVIRRLHVLNETMGRPTPIIITPEGLLVPPGRREHVERPDC